LSWTQVNLVAVLFSATWSFVGSFVIFKAMNACFAVRVRPEVEALGLDLCLHGESLLMDDVTDLAARKDLFTNITRE
jgi:ammonia channel protein AmtB